MQRETKGWGGIIYLFIEGFCFLFWVDFYWEIKGIKENKKKALKHAGLTLAHAWRKQNGIPAQKAHVPFAVKPSE